ncbi:MAG: hypothetical protein VB876_12860, partial [Pirellulales bacterium]
MLSKSGWRTNRIFRPVARRGEIRAVHTGIFAAAGTNITVIGPTSSTNTLPPHLKSVQKLGYPNG